MAESRTARAPAILFDLDGTLIDSNYEHVAAWRLAFRKRGIEVPNAFLHRCIGMRGELLIRAVYHERPERDQAPTTESLERLHKKYFTNSLPSIKVLPGALELLKTLSRLKAPWAICTGGDKQTVFKMIQPLKVPATVPVVTSDDVDQAKPEPDVFLLAARELGVALSDCVIVGDSVWDLLGARRGKAIGVGLRCGGYGDAELVLAGAYRVYKDPADLLDNLAQIGLNE